MYSKKKTQCLFMGYYPQGPLFLEFNFKMKLGDQLILLQKILKVGGFII